MVFPTNQHEKARKLIVQIVNAMSAKMEMGGPMACMYLLGHEDHYTSHSFKTFFWKVYVNQVRNIWEKEDAMDVDCEDQVVLNRVQSNVVGLSPVLDYMHRPSKFKDMTLYDWVCCAVKSKIRKGRCQ
jgi:hypothetical protein